MQIYLTTWNLLVLFTPFTPNHLCVWRCCGENGLALMSYSQCLIHADLLLIFREGFMRYREALSLTHTLIWNVSPCCLFVLFLYFSTQSVFLTGFSAAPLARVLYFRISLCPLNLLYCHLFCFLFYILHSQYFLWLYFLFKPFYYPYHTSLSFSLFFIVTLLWTHIYST